MKPLKSMLDPLLRRTEGRPEDPGHTLMKSSSDSAVPRLPPAPDSSRLVENCSHRPTRYWRRRPKWAQVTAFLNESFISRQAGIVGDGTSTASNAARPNRRLARIRSGQVIGSTAPGSAHERFEHAPLRLSWNLCVRRAVGTMGGSSPPETAPDTHIGSHTPRARPPAVGTAFQESR